MVLDDRSTTTIGGGKIGVCPLSFPYHATRPACPNPAAEEKHGASPKGGLGRTGRLTGWLCLLGTARQPRRSEGRKGWLHKHDWQVRDCPDAHHNGIRFQHIGCFPCMIPWP